MQKEILKEIDRNSTVTQVQKYVEKMVTLRGFADQPVQESVLLLLEEMGELAKAIRKSETRMSVDLDNMQNFGTVESEVADIFFVLLAICNQTNVNLFDALKEKEQLNCERNWSFQR